MKIFNSINTLNNNDNIKVTIGFVPTMGALHKGHISLIKKCQKISEKTLVSIYVNPAQFDKKNDFNNYPQNINKDIKILKKLKVDYLLIPNTKEIYKSKKEMKINISNKYKVLCAKNRPGHFEGVLAVINQFIKRIKPKYLFLGSKDFQQLFLIKKFIGKKFKTKIIECKTIRDDGFLPYSSRNLILSKSNLKIAQKISKKLHLFYNSTKKNFANRNKIEILKNKIRNYNVKIDYLEIRNKNNLSRKFTKSNFKIFLSYYIQKVRLIDNL